MTAQWVEINFEVAFLLLWEINKLSIELLIMNCEWVVIILWKYRWINLRILLLKWFQPLLERGEGVELTSCQMTVVAKQGFQKILYNCVLTGLTTIPM